jgi:DnaK suppressor protein
MSFSAQSTFDKYVLLQFKSGLREQERSLHESIDQAEKTIRELGDAEPRDIADAASGQSLEVSVIAQVTQNRSRLRLVQLALERIRVGTFGTCAECGDAISLRRLQAVPWANHCIQWQERYEQGGFAGSANSFEPVHV